MLRSVFAKVIHDQWRIVLAWAAFSALWPAMYVSLFPSISTIADLQQILDQLPPEIREFFAGSELDLATPEGFLNVEMFSFIGPLLVLAYTVGVASGATAGEEERGTLDLLMANPVSRRRVVLEKSFAFLLGTIVVGAGMWAGAAVGSLLVDVDLDLWLVAQAVASVVLLGLAFGGFALALGAITGRRWLSAGVALMVAIASFFLNGLGALVDWLEAWRPLSPFYHYIANDPLKNGLDPGSAAVLAVLTLVGVAVTVVAFERRDLAR